MTTRRLIAAAVAATLGAVVVATVAANRLVHQRHRDPGTPPAATARSTLVVKTATAFVTALDDIDRTRPHGDLHALRPLTDAHLLAQLASASSLTFAQLHAGAVQHAAVTSVATRVTADDAVALVTAQLTVTSDGTPPLRTVTSYTLTLRRSTAGWLVVEATA